MTAGEIADRFKHSWPTTTRHLSVLESAELIAVNKQGRRRIYALRPLSLIRAADWIYAWSLAAEEEAAGGRPDWADLPYASMRNATPPGQGGE